jgi:hypothetical protein
MAMIDQADITDVPGLVQAMTGLCIVGGGHEGPDGIHLELSDGRYLVITGVFVIGLCRVGKEYLN